MVNKDYQDYQKSRTNSPIVKRKKFLAIPIANEKKVLYLQHRSHWVSLTFGCCCYKLLNEGHNNKHIIKVTLYHRRHHRSLKFEAKCILVLYFRRFRPAHFTVTRQASITIINITVEGITINSYSRQFRNTCMYPKHLLFSISYATAT